LSGGDFGEGGGPQKDLINTIKRLIPLDEEAGESYMEVVVNLEELPFSSIETIHLNSITIFFIVEDDQSIEVPADEVEYFYLDKEIGEEESTPIALTSVKGIKLFSGETYISTSFKKVKVKVMIVF